MPFSFAVAAAALVLTVPEEPLGRSLRDAIWHDLQVNAWIGNGNWLAGKWYLAGNEEVPPPTLEVKDLKCRPKSHAYHCEFQLLRHGGPATFLGEQAPYQLHCNAPLEQDKVTDTWYVKHLPASPKGGHTRTSMRCKEVPGNLAT